MDASTEERRGTIRGAILISIDLKRTYREHYTAKDRPMTVDVPRRPYLMIDGEGDPNTAEAYQDAVAALYPLAYGLRRSIKESTDIAYTVMPLEGLWWVDDMARFSLDEKSDWKWTAMICQPEEVSPELASEVLPQITTNKRLVAGGLARIALFGDGLAAQIMHHGPYADEALTIEALHGFIDDEGYEFSGKHHEIYLTDPRRSAPAKNRTIIRQPVTSRPRPRRTASESQ